MKLSPDVRAHPMHLDSITQQQQQQQQQQSLQQQVVDGASSEAAAAAGAMVSATHARFERPVVESRSSSNDGVAADSIEEET
eukprot:1190340-Prorocentrum_minimum.AAC.5